MTSNVVGYKEEKRDHINRETQGGVNSTPNL